MQDNLNQFTQYSTFSTYNKIFTDQSHLYLPSAKNPLDYYTKRNLELPKYIKPEQTKVFSDTAQMQQTKSELPQLPIASTSIKQYTTEIEKLCSYTNNFLDERRAIKQQPFQISSTPQTLQNLPLQNDDFDKFKNLMKKEGIDMDESQFEYEFKQFMEFRSNRSLNLDDNRHLKSDDTLIKQKTETQQLSQVASKKSLNELYVRNQRKEMPKRFQSTGKQRFLPPSLSQLNYHNDKEIQKALDVLTQQQQQQQLGLTQQQQQYYGKAD